MKKICFVTATRAEYGLLKWLMREVEKSDKFEIQVVATGAHLMKEQGYTIDLIKEDDFIINKTVDAKARVQKYMRLLRIKKLMEENYYEKCITKNYYRQSSWTKS